MTAPRGVSVVVVGAGPTASSLLERIAANAGELLADRHLTVHLVDPFRAGTGRVWREDLDPRLWMNSMAEDVTLFVDESVRCAGPQRPGPSLHEWAGEVDDATLEALGDDVLADEIRAIGPMSFPTRRVQSVYLDWFHRSVLAALPANVTVDTHRARAVHLDDLADGRQAVTLDDGTILDTDVVVLAQGHLDAVPDTETAEHTAFARRHGLVHLPPSHTADTDLSALGAGEDVIVLGFGQAFTDLLVLVTEARGGRFEGDGDRLRYVPSGREPILHVGSRRGVPYRSKLPYRLQGPPAPLPRFLDDAAIDRLTAAAPLEFVRDVRPLLEREAAWASYHELFHAHPERVTTSWDEFDRDFASASDGPELAAVVVRSIPDPDDHFDIDALDRPLTDVHAASADDLHRLVAGHIDRDVARRTDPANSGDLGAFLALLGAFGALGRLGPALTPRSRVDDLGAWWFSFFMYYASGPPPQRLRQLLALADAGLVRFAGGDLRVVHDEANGTFVATSANHPDAITARALVDARIAAPSLSRTADALLADLHRRGEAVEEVARDSTGWERNTGKVLVGGGALRLVRADGTTHPRRHALGTFTSRPAAGAFARPRTNAPAFRQNDTIARAILTTLAATAASGAIEGGEVVRCTAGIVGTSAAGAS